MRAFVVRPFGTKSGIDFERVQEELIDPALAALNVDGGTTESILEAGNIRVDMFHALITADVVIVDVSLNNANVYYELGIRHALRSRATYLIRSRADAYPFNLQTDRYLEYEAATPGGKLDQLVEGLRATLANDRTDSPVHLLAPGLESVNPSRLIAVPADFSEDVARAVADKSAGDLDLYSEEVLGLPWEREGLRVVGKAQFKLEINEGARITWEALRKLDPDDLEANTLLATTYQRLRNLAESDLAIERVTSRKDVGGHDRAEALSLAARNAKDLWRAAWKDAAPAAQRKQALASPYLQQAADAYREAFLSELNHYYPGINALGLYTVLAELGAALPDDWNDLYTNADPPFTFDTVKKRREQLVHAVRVSVDAARAAAAHKGKPDRWVEATAADLRFLTDTNSAAVRAAYDKALASASPQEIEAVARQLEIYRDLGINAAVASAELEQLKARRPEALAAVPARVLVFTGHRVDAPGRKKPRFPASKVEAAKAAIAKMVAAERGTGSAYGIAGGASGGDILFHEVCAESGIPTRLFLALPKEKYAAESVTASGGDWLARFYALTKSLPTRILSQTPELPRWLVAKKRYGFWERNNEWTLHHALAAGAQNVTLIALWDRASEGDGPGGTAHMVRTATDRGAQVRIIDVNTLPETT